MYGWLWDILNKDDTLYKQEFVIRMLADYIFSQIVGTLDIGGAEQENTFNYSCEPTALKNSITKCYCKNTNLEVCTLDPWFVNALDLG